MNNNFITKIINTYKKGTIYDKLFNEFQKLLKIINTERKQFTNTITKLENENTLLHSDLLECSEKQNKAPQDTFSLKITLSNLKKKVSSKPFKYAYKGDGKVRDVREVLECKYVTLIEMYGKKVINAYNPKTPLECVEAVIKYFIYKKKPKYVTDEKKWNKRDYWESADVFLTTWTGDCDAVSNAQHNIIKYVLEQKGFKEHYNRLYWHINDNYLGGHANNLWLHEDGYFYTIESTIDAKGTFNKKWLKVPLANDSFYTGTRGIINYNYNYTGNGEVDSNFL